MAHLQLGSAPRVLFMLEFRLMDSPWWIHAIPAEAKGNGQTSGWLSRCRQVIYVTSTYIPMAKAHYMAESDVKGAEMYTIS